ncbi:MAG TPA: hypothetical protein VFP58_13705 [Candidatus Eisenbacteria bacterium]|nr:hypothetical protein [Candidatus Eisenbacteria bacterium]
MPLLRLIATLLVAGLLAGCSLSEEEASFLAKRDFLKRQNQGIRELIEEEEKGSIVPTGRFLVGIHETVVGDLLRSQLPLTRPLGKRFVLRLERATVLLRDKFGVITLDGEIHRPQTPHRKTAIRVFGGLGAVAVDSVSDLLHIDIAVDHIELVEAGLLEGILGAGSKKFLAERGRELLQDELPRLTVPVRLGRSIRVPPIREGALQLDSLVVPLHLSVERVIAAREKLWVTLHAEVGTVTGAERGLAVAVKKKPRPGDGK